MGLFLICPHCQTKLPLACRTCLGCGVDLRYLPSQDRHYFIGEPCASEAAGAAPEKSPEPLPETLDAEFIDPFAEIVEAAVLETHPNIMVPETPRLDSKDVSLCEALDRILNKGAVLFGEVTISVADIDLVYLGLQVILASMETARGFKPALGEGQVGPNLFDRGAQ
jgi:hypothetical protein